jgi:hypothetical protein
MTAGAASGGATAPTVPMIPSAPAVPLPPPAAAPSAAPAAPRRLLPILLVIAATLVVVVAGVAWLVKDRLAPAAGGREGPAAATATGTGTDGLLVVHAVPWAEVVSVTASGGAAQPVPPRASTPLSLAVPAGTYTVAVRSPESGAVTTMTVQVRAGETARCLAEVGKMDTETFLAGMGW